MCCCWSWLLHENANTVREQMLEKIIEISPPFDRRHEDPSKNYGIGGMTLRFILKGPKGATQFMFYTAQHLQHVADELYFRNRSSRYNPFKGMGADIGYHSHRPMYEGHTPMNGTCDVLGGQCYYDGSSLQASEFEETFLREGTPAVWKMLEERYHSLFSEADISG
jgi:hypothetical protein